MELVQGVHLDLLDPLADPGELDPQVGLDKEAALEPQGGRAGLDPQDGVVLLEDLGVLENRV